ncbi:MAG: hypothetical protein Q9207_006360, partial [Kuettlingeria erythrocarpa]
MASNDPGLAPIVDAKRHVVPDNDDDVENILQNDRPIAPDQFDPTYETTRNEVWAYYAYYIGDNGLTLFNFAPTAFQNLLSQAAGDSEVLQFAGRVRTINSIVLLANGISFAIQVVIFLVIGSYAGNRGIDLISDSTDADRLWALETKYSDRIVTGGIWDRFRMAGCSHSQQMGSWCWHVHLIAYQTTLTFWTAAFPTLARNTPELRASAQAYTSGTISRADYDHADMLQRSRLANTAFYIQSLGELIILAAIVGILFALDVHASEANNNWGLSYFLLGDSLNTTVTVIATLQNSIVQYDTLTLTYLLLVGIAAQAVGIYSFWWIQRRFGLGTKAMFTAVMVGIILL